MNILARYIAETYLRAFGATLLIALTVFLAVDVVDRVVSYAEYEPTFGQMTAFYLLRLPRIFSDLYPAVSLLAVLASAGLLARRNELMAMVAAGVSERRIAWPLVAVAGLLSVAVIVWNETIVPPAATEARRIKNVLIKQKRDPGLFNAASIWFQDEQGFVNIEYFDAAHSTIHELTLFVVDPSYRLRRMIEVPVGRWTGGGWQWLGGTVKEIDPDGRSRKRPLEPGDLRLDDPPADLSKRRPNAEELTWFELRHRIAVLRAKGLEADDLRVDLHAKLAIPLSGLVSVLIGFPLAARGARRRGLSFAVGAGLVVGFAYWATMALAFSAGRAGLLPPVAAAWAANIVFAALGFAAIGVRTRGRRA